MIVSYRFSKFLHCICQDDVTTSSVDITSRNKLRGHVRENILGKVTEEILEICYGSGVMQQKVGMGVNIPPLGSMCVKLLTVNLPYYCHGGYTFYFEIINTRYDFIEKDIISIVMFKTRNLIRQPNTV